MDWIQIMLTIYLIERVSIDRKRYKLHLYNWRYLWMLERESDDQPYYRSRRICDLLFWSKFFRRK